MRDYKVTVTVVLIVKASNVDEAQDVAVARIHNNVQAVEDILVDKVESFTLMKP